MTKNKNISISLEGAKCIEVDETPSSGDKIIDISNTGDKVIETSVSSGKVMDTIVDSGNKIHFIDTKGKGKVLQLPKQPIWVWIVLVLFLLFIVGSGSFVGYLIIEEIERQEGIETPHRDEQRQAEEEAECMQREIEQQEAARKEARRSEAQRERSLREAEERAKLETEERVRREEKQRSAGRAATQQNSQQVQQQHSQTSSNSENNKRHYQGHVEFTLKDGSSMRWEYDGYYTEEEFREMERQFYERAGYSTEESEKMQNLLKEIQVL